MVFLDIDYRLLHIFVSKWMEVGWVNILRRYTLPIKDNINCVSWQYLLF